MSAILKRKRSSVGQKKWNMRGNTYQRVFICTQANELMEMFYYCRWQFLGGQQEFGLACPFAFHRGTLVTCSRSFATFDVAGAGADSSQQVGLAFSGLARLHPAPSHPTSSKQTSTTSTPKRDFSLCSSHDRQHRSSWYAIQAHCARSRALECLSLHTWQWASEDVDFGAGCSNASCSCDFELRRFAIRSHFAKF